MKGFDFKHIEVDTTWSTFADGIIKHIFLNENVQISLKFVPKGPANKRGNVCLDNGMIPKKTATHCYLVQWSVTSLCVYVPQWESVIQDIIQAKWFLWQQITNLGDQTSNMEIR